MSDYYNRSGTPIDLMLWANLSNVPEYKVVRRTRFQDITISTVWLGLDHNFMGVGPPVIFETMVFGGSEQWDGYQERYSTEEAAIHGHDIIVTEVRLTEGDIRWEMSDESSSE